MSAKARVKGLAHAKEKVRLTKATDFTQATRLQAEPVQSVNQDAQKKNGGEDRDENQIQEETGDENEEVNRKEKVALMNTGSHRWTLQ